MARRPLWLVFAAVAIDGARAQANACNRHLTCGSCLSNSVSTENALNEGCFWCYSTASCQRAEMGFDAFGGCPDVGVSPQMCQCRPDTFNSCDKCATAAHPFCTWVEKDSETQLTVAMKLFGHWSEYTLAPTVSETGHCTVGTGFGPSGLDTNATLIQGELGTLRVEVVTTPSKWYWAQCQVPGLPPVLFFITGVLVAFGICSAGISCLLGGPAGTRGGIRKLF